MRLAPHALAATVLLVGVACRPDAPAPPGPPRPPPLLSVERVRAAFPEGVADEAGWARDLLSAFAAAEVPPDAVHVCAAVAVLQQESGFQADPPVANLASLVRTRLSEEAGRYGPVGTSALRSLLAERAPGDRRTFDERIRRLRTERELDLLFRDMLDAERRMHPAMVATANLLDTVFRGRRLDDLNPVTTAGSMQVSVRWAIAWAKQRGLPSDETAVRDALYTRAGGLRFGVARLWAWPAEYPEVLWRFADYNAGEYASRNAAVQRALAKLTGVPLALDGDLLAYGPDGTPRGDDGETMAALRTFREKFAPRLPEGALRRDVETEKSAGFSGTPTYQAVRDAWRASTGAPLPSAVMPELVLKSPKLRRGYTTAAYARSVERHHRACLQRLRDGAPP